MGAVEQERGRAVVVVVKAWWRDVPVRQACVGIGGNGGPECGGEVGGERARDRKQE